MSILGSSQENLYSLEENRQTYTAYLGDTLNSTLHIRQCPVEKMTVCVTSDPEYEKCIKMKVISTDNADVAVFDAGDVYTAELQYDLIPFISEVYNLGVPEYYVVAVAKEEDPSTEMTYLKAAEYFGKSCAPGAVSSEYVTDTANDNLCHLCHGSSYKYCQRDANEDYYGFTGAFRCLVEGGGHVAFLKHTTVYENTDGKRKEWWARNALSEDFQLLCPDGDEANAIVTRGGDQYNEQEINAYINLFVYAQQFYSRKDDEEFSMFMSPPPYSDLIFQDATQQLRVIEPAYRSYDKYLGSDFMRARRIVDCRATASSKFFL
ncbi:Ferric iron binding [Sarracenia purpurea var. burkii]